MKGFFHQWTSFFTSATKETRLAARGPVCLMRNGWLYAGAGVFVASLLLLMVGMALPLFDGAEAEMLGLWGKPLFLALAAAASGLLLGLRFKVQGKAGFWLYTILYLLTPLATYFMVELFVGQDAFGRTPEEIFMNVAAYFLVYLLILAVSGSYRWSVVIGTALFYAFATACHFVGLFRGSPFVPLDIFSAGTGMNVAANYTFELSVRWVAATVLAALEIGVGFQLGNGNLKRVRWKVSLRALAVMAALGVGTFFFSQDYLEDHGYTIAYWNQQENYDKFGSWLAFCLNLKNVFPEVPAGYDAETVETIARQSLSAQGIDPDGGQAYNLLTGENDYAATTQTPNIVMVMNESFSDLTAAGDVKTNIPVAPFFDSLEENTIRGNLQISTFGGGTACTEYEVLTGNSQRFLPAGAVAYSANLHSATPSLAWTLRAQGYSAEAFHPYYASGWNRPKAYDYLGFEDFISLEDVVSPEILSMEATDRMKAVESLAPEDGDVYNRDYMSDHYDFALVKELFEARNGDKPYFLFNVTIQNHGGYEYGAANFTERLRITNMDGDYPQAERYLSLMRASDDAFKELITYFESVDEPTLVVMFGDHRPALDEGFYEELYGKSLETLRVEDLETYYQTPFVIWANYDIPEKDLGEISANYLSTLVLEAAGLEMPLYNRYLATLYSQLPVVSGAVFQEADGRLVYRREDLSNGALLNDYQCLAYNHLLDYRHRDWSLFTLDGQALP